MPGVVEVVDAEELLDAVDARLGQGDRLALLVQLEVLAGAQTSGDPVVDVVPGRILLDGTRDDQGRPGLVDEDAVDLVDDGVVVAPLDHVLEADLHVVPQVVEAELVVRPVRDVAGVGPTAFLVVHVVLDDADGQAEGLIDGAHPVAVPLGQVVVDRDDVDALARQGVEVRRERGDQRLPLAGRHLGDLALMQDDAAHELDVEVAHVEDPPGRLPDDGEGLDEEVVQRLAGGQTAPELVGLGPELGVREPLHVGLQGVDAVDDPPEPPDLPFVLGPEDFAEDSRDQRHGRTSVCGIRRGAFGIPRTRHRNRSSLRDGRKATDPRPASAPRPPGGLVPGRSEIGPTEPASYGVATRKWTVRPSRRTSHRTGRARATWARRSIARRTACSNS